MNWYDNQEFNDLQNDISVAREENYYVRRRGHKDLYRRIDLATEWMNNDPDYMNFKLNDMQKRESIVIGISPNNKVKCNFCESIIVPDHRGRFHGFCNLRCINRNKYHLETQGSRYNELFQEGYYEIFRKLRFNYEEIVNYFGVSPQLVQKRYWELGLRTEGEQRNVLLAREHLLNNFGQEDTPDKFSYPLQVFNDGDLLFNMWRDSNYRTGQISEVLCIPHHFIARDLSWFGYKTAVHGSPQADLFHKDLNFAKDIYRILNEDINKIAKFLCKSPKSVYDYLNYRNIREKSAGGWLGKAIRDRDSTNCFIYIMEFSPNENCEGNENFIKVGISTNPRVRLTGLKNEVSSNYNVTNIYLSNQMEKWKCHIAEQIVLNKCGSVKYKPKCNFNGRTECLHPAFKNRSIIILDHLTKNDFGYEGAAKNRSYL